MCTCTIRGRGPTRRADCSGCVRMCAPVACRPHPYVPKTKTRPMLVFVTFVVSVIPQIHARRLGARKWTRARKHGWGGGCASHPPSPSTSSTSAAYPTPSSNHRFPLPRIHPSADPACLLARPTPCLSRPHVALTLTRIQYASHASTSSPHPAFLCASPTVNLVHLTRSTHLEARQRTRGMWIVQLSLGAARTYRPRGWDAGFRFEG
ncbi:hypothetical protein B0H16DRAFT_94366 [Mycena metata]|uniref:Uncharacterized protein n=1 Tax=Mycena metata TaxID=1033252 RepID=A0AAD7ICC6_9AGAR|nr:hypothetical protein B0H16DRAFT_93677 [Mycena metata]KAJ7738611.1 hypothetical protein B0H16DRAFT_94366 [Mycena metata]